MRDSFDCSAYSLDDLRDARDHIDRVARPERAAEIDRWIEVRAAERQSAEPSLAPLPVAVPFRWAGTSALAGCALLCLGLVCLVMVVGIRVVSRGRSHTEASKEVAFDVVDAVTQTWTSDTLVANASAEFRAKVSDANLHGVFAIYRKLGARKRLHDPVGGFKATAGFGAMASGMTAEYAFPAEFVAGPATIRITLAREGGAWRVTGFWVESDVLFGR
jgi:hypothetical protein